MVKGTSLKGPSLTTWGPPARACLGYVVALLDEPVGNKDDNSQAKHLSERRFIILVTVTGGLDD